MPESEEQRLINDIKSGAIDNIQQVLDRFAEINNNYPDYRWAWSYQMILDYYKLDELDAFMSELPVKFLTQDSQCLSESQEIQ